MMIFRRTQRAIPSPSKSNPVFQRKTAMSGFWEELAQSAPKYKNVVIVNNGLPRESVPGALLRAFGERSVELGSFSLSGMGQAVGFVLAGKNVILLGRSSDLAGRAWSFLAEIVGESRLNLKCVGVADPDDKDLALMKLIPTMTVLEPLDYLQACDAAHSLCEAYGPTYVRLAGSRQNVILGAD